MWHSLRLRLRLRLRTRWYEPAGWYSLFNYSLFVSRRFDQSNACGSSLGKNEIDSRAECVGDINLACISTHAGGLSGGSHQ